MLLEILKINFMFQPSYATKSLSRQTIFLRLKFLEYSEKNNFSSHNVFFLFIYLLQLQIFQVLLRFFSWGALMFILGKQIIIKIF